MGATRLIAELELQLCPGWPCHMKPEQQPAFSVPTGNSGGTLPRVPAASWVSVPIPVSITQLGAGPDKQAWGSWHACPVVPQSLFSSLASTS
jgi:hypothetical protein